MTKLKSYIEWFIVISTIIIGFSWFFLGDFLPPANASIAPPPVVDISTITKRFYATSFADSGKHIRKYTQEELAKISDEDAKGVKIYNLNNLTSSQISIFISAPKKEILGIIVVDTESKDVLNTAQKITKINGKKCILTLEKSKIIQLSTGDLLNQIKAIGFETCPDVSEEASQPVE
ncbi:MAG TPA: hypothetical protein VJB35_06685 [Candidatus Nanoarchaeia archaeon]|nr:hypothetical protein [Candidatus Nanoarchaeia archaeon]